MARPSRNEIATQELKKAIDGLRRRHPNVGASNRDLALELYAQHGAKVSFESFRRAFAGDIDPTACAVELLMALTEAFDVEPEALGHFAADRIKATLSLAAQYGGGDGGRGLDSTASGWLSQTGRHLVAV